MENKEPKFEILHMPPENTNSVLVSVGGDAVIFDAWGRASDWENLLKSRGLNLRAIYSTHGHSDHISAAPELAAQFNVPWFLNRRDENLILWGNPILDFFELPHIDSDYKSPSDLTVGRAEILDGVVMDVIETDGHSAGGVSFYFPDFGVLLTGDTIFRDGVGRYDLPTGDAVALQKSIQKLYDLNLPDETYVVHGHGLDSTINWLKHNHPYFGGTHCCHNNGDCCCGGGCKCHEHK